MPRTRHTHNCHISALKGSVSGHASIIYGVTGDSILNSSMYSLVTEGLCPDVMHDVLEEAAQYEVKELFNYFVNSHILALYELNSVIDNFPYFYTDLIDTLLIIA